jgi:hypothetical protein
MISSWFDANMEARFSMSSKRGGRGCSWYMKQGMGMIWRVVERSRTIMVLRPKKGLHICRLAGRGLVVLSKDSGGRLQPAGGTGLMVRDDELARL